MSDEFDRDALFSDIDKIMAKQGYTGYSPASEPVEIEAYAGKIKEEAESDLISSELNEPITIEPITIEPSPEYDPNSVTAPDYSGFDAQPETNDEPETYEGVVSTPLVDTLPDSGKTGANRFISNTGDAADQDTEPVFENNSKMFTTIDEPKDWTPDEQQTARVREIKDESPSVSYLDDNLAAGYSQMENVAFGDVSVGVETESVEFSVGHPLLRLLRNILICVAAALVLSLIVTKFVAHHTSVDGSSMMNTLVDGDQLIVEQVSYYFHDPERFDVIVFPISTQDNYIKRIIGLPGETVQIKDSQIYINGNLLTDDRYGREPIEDPGIATDTIYLKSDEYFVLGDNRNASVDSRFSEVGLIKKKDIKGKAWLRIFPFASFGTIS